ncbi:hypothetical protein VIBNISFn27_480105 [Vibrio nigripulchritudo SFn27]|nr:hypothetical protein VIBNIMADA3020_1240030 [Vibrio nigripulchritudo MADA3020]CCN83467.1 hypothetical protein VIBNIBLFn1_600104 [Vibrio nigripulchritudo BLFn1]CCN88826.1 hypothetical protein VIBNISFn27_480105 [Vibrio nigripulchritudo SFn27]CCO41171.1 hypothetical protein VIBNISFn135_410105 [Vibrio nigripulchritudo SFn135]CCO52488.1 hypothetical protein VIBNIWn13_330105 [Vibrio nigripulchritudo Wn13]
MNDLIVNSVLSLRFGLPRMTPSKPKQINKGRNDGSSTDS